MWGFAVSRDAQFSRQRKIVEIFCLRFKWRRTRENSTRFLDAYQCFKRRSAKSHKLLHPATSCLSHSYNSNFLESFVLDRLFLHLHREHFGTDEKRRCRIYFRKFWWICFSQTGDRGVRWIHLFSFCFIHFFFPRVTPFSFSFERITSESANDTKECKIA